MGHRSDERRRASCEGSVRHHVHNLQHVCCDGGRIGIQDLSFASPNVKAAPISPTGSNCPYGQLARQIRALRDRYLESGFGHGHRACLLLENRPDFIVHWLALNSIGVSIVPINPAYRAAEIEYLISHAEPDLIVTLQTRRSWRKQSRLMSRCLSCPATI